MTVPIMLQLVANAISVFAILLLRHRYRDLLRRHREAKQTLNRIAGERDELRWEKMLAGRQ